MSARSCSFGTHEYDDDETTRARDEASNRTQTAPTQQRQQLVWSSPLLWHSKHMGKTIRPPFPHTHTHTRAQLFHAFRIRGVAVREARTRSTHPLLTAATLSPRRMRP